MHKGCAAVLTLKHCRRGALLYSLPACLTLEIRIVRHPMVGVHCFLQGSVPPLDAGSCCRRSCQSQALTMNDTPTAEISSWLLGAHRHRSTASPALTSRTAGYLWLYFPALCCKSHAACGSGEGAGVKKNGVSGQCKQLDVLLEYEHIDCSLIPEKGLWAVAASVHHQTVHSSMLASVSWYCWKYTLPEHLVHPVTVRDS